MSQDEEETSKYIPKHNNNHNNCRSTCTTVNNNNDNKNKNNNNQQVMPLYENCTLNTKNSNNTNEKQDHSLLQRSPTQSDSFNYEKHFVKNTTNCSIVNENGETRDLSECEYVNINFLTQNQFDKKLLLQKYFRSALVGPRSNIYENLCRGCNYGVFNARGPLCSFCECIVNGVSAIRSDTPADSSLNENNIYENICELCGTIYSGSPGSECKCRLNNEIEDREFNRGSEEQLLEKTREEKRVKINKSKSFSKNNRSKIFTSFWETLRKPKSSGSINNKKPIEIIHHVGGYEQVFHTKDTFDLRKICELKRSGTSCSDQHIYGRLKQHDIVSLGHEGFNSTQSLSQSDLKVLSKKPRISKAKFLRSSSIKAETEVYLSNATIYLSNSVCQWMTSLRREVHNYSNEDTVCYPKSIPSKNLLDLCKVALVTNRLNKFGNVFEGDLTEIHQLTSHNSVTLDSKEIEHHQHYKDCYQLMVEEFMEHILNKHMKSNNDNNNSNVQAMSAVSNNDLIMAINNCHGHRQSTDIPLRQANLTTKTSTINNNNNNRHKRQGMYLRLEDQCEHLQLEEQDNNSNGKECKNLLNSEKNKNIFYENSITCISEKSIILRNLNAHEEHKTDRDKTNQYDGSEHNAGNTIITATPANHNANDLVLVSRCLDPSINNRDLKIINKRCAVHERSVLKAFEALLEQEAKNAELEKKRKVEVQETESQKCDITLDLSTFGDNPQSTTQYFPSQILDIVQLIKQQQMSTSLNTIIICYDKYLMVFLRYIFETNRKNLLVVNTIPIKQLVRKFQRFYRKYEKINTIAETAKTYTNASTSISGCLKFDLNISNGSSGKLICGKYNESSSECLKVSSQNNNNNNISVKINPKIKTPPQVPKRDPKTKLSPTAEIKRFLSSSQVNSNLKKMTVPSNNLRKETLSDCSQKEEESIYQPIWKFETKGNVAERYRTDDDYYDIKALKEKLQQDSPNSEIPKILISSDIIQEEEEDNSNWEPDEEFIYTKDMQKQRSSSLNSEQNSTIRSNHSSNSSIITSSLSGSTITEFASSTATLASTVSSSLKHYLFRNIGIFYSLTEPKLRAIIYDYDRVHSSTYFAKTPTSLTFLTQNDSGIEKSLSPQLYSFKHRSTNSSPSTSNKSSPVFLTKKEFVNKSIKTSESVKVATVAQGKVPCPTQYLSVARSIQAWKLQLLDVNFMEDEEDMIVSECEILRAQESKDGLDQSSDIQTQQPMQRFKSRSTENLIDDKKTITERLANMYTRFSPIQRGILNINGRSSPKSEKKAYKLNRASQSTSLYLEDGIRPKYPIFGAPLDQLELQQNVPRFVVDAVEYIERKDRIIQDGIYRACGNKFSIDELKQKLCKSYIYDSKLIVADDIHTVTSLLKQFFRDIPEPVVPQTIYNRITSSLSDKHNIDSLRIAIEEMKEPNKSTLRFLIKHLTNVAACSSSNRMNASNVAIVWGPSLFAQNDTYDMIGRMNTLTKVLIESYDRIFDTNERLL